MYVQQARKKNHSEHLCYFFVTVSLYFAKKKLGCILICRSIDLKLSESNFLSGKWNQTEFQVDRMADEGTSHANFSFIGPFFLEPSKWQTCTVYIHLRLFLRIFYILRETLKNLLIYRPIFERWLHITD